MYKVYQYLSSIIILTISVLKMHTSPHLSALLISACRTQYGLDITSLRNIQAPQAPSRLQWTLWVGFRLPWSISSEQSQGQQAKTSRRCNMMTISWEALLRILLRAFRPHEVSLVHVFRSIVQSITEPQNFHIYSNEAILCGAYDLEHKEGGASKAEDEVYIVSFV